MGPMVTLAGYDPQKENENKGMEKNIQEKKI